MRTLFTCWQLIARPVFACLNQDRLHSDALRAADIL